MNAPVALRELVDEAQHFAVTAIDEEQIWPAALDLAVLSLREPQPPDFIVDDWFPVGYATLLAGHGGVGKSGIALCLAVCMALGLPFFGIKIKQRKVLYLSCEDRENILHWRLSRICKFLNVNLNELNGKLDILDLVGRESILWERDPRTGNTHTAAYAELREYITEHGIEVLVVDGISDTFAGNENARGDVKRFVNSLVALIPQDRGAVLLVGHVAKPTASLSKTAEGYSGSTGWHNSVRARWYLYGEPTQNDDGNPSKSSDLLLELQKSNLGKTDQSIRFSWNDAAHMFVGKEIVAATASDIAHRDRLERDAILAAIKGCQASNPPLIVPAALSGPRSTHKVLSQRSEFPKNLRHEKHRFWRHIEYLRQFNALVELEYIKSNRHKGSQFVLSTEEMRQCASAQGKELTHD